MLRNCTNGLKRILLNWPEAENFSFALPLALLLAGGSTIVGFAPPASADTDAKYVYTSITGPELQRLIQKWGYRAELGTDNTGDPKISSAVSGANFSIYFYGCDTQAPKRCDSISFSAAFDLDEGLTAAYINEWNRTKRFGNAWIDDEGDPFLNMQVNIDGGIAEDAIRQNLDWWEIGMSGYLEYIGW